VPNLERTRLDRVRRLIHDYPNTTMLVVAVAVIAIIGIAVPDNVAIWAYLILAGVLVGWVIFCLVQLERVSRRGRSR